MMQQPRCNLGLGLPGGGVLQVGRGTCVSLGAPACNPHAAARLCTFGGLRNALGIPGGSRSGCSSLGGNLVRGGGGGAYGGGGGMWQRIGGTAATGVAAAVRPCLSLPPWAAERAMDALKDEHDKPTDREVAAAATTALVATSATIQHSKTAVGYLFKEAPLLTWLPLLACVAVAAAGVAVKQLQLVWAAVGALASFVLTIWQVLAPLVRRFQALRAHLLDNDRAAKQRLDTAAGQLSRARCERDAALKGAEQAQRELSQLRQQAVKQAAPAATVPSDSVDQGSSNGVDGGDSTRSSSSSSNGSEAGGAMTGPGAEEGAGQEDLQRQLEERQRQDMRLTAILNNALNAAAVPPVADGNGEGCAASDMSSDLDAVDGYAERPVDRNNAVELAGALQSRVDLLRRQAQQAAAEHQEVARLRAELQRKSEAVAALEIRLAHAQVATRKLPQLQQYLEDTEWQLLQEQQRRQQELQRLGQAAGAAAGAAAAAENARPAANAARRRGRPRGSTRRPQQAAQRQEPLHAQHPNGGLASQDGAAAAAAAATATEDAEKGDKSATAFDGSGKPANAADGGGKPVGAADHAAEADVEAELEAVRHQISMAEQQVDAVAQVAQQLGAQLEQLHDELAQQPQQEPSQGH